MNAWKSNNLWVVRILYIDYLFIFSIDYQTMH